jgi:hypothetical protein
MGSFYTNVQVKSDEPEAVMSAVEGCGALPAYVSRKAHNGWTSVYPKATESQDGAVLADIASKLSQALSTGAVGMLVHDSDIFQYVLCENGSKVDQYDPTCVVSTAAARDRAGGNPKFC